MRRAARSPALTAVVLAIALATIALGAAFLPASLVFLAVAGPLGWLGVCLYRANIDALGAGAAPRRVGGWLIVLVVVLPNTLMALLLYTEPAKSGPMALLGWVLMLFAFTVASLYYLVPAWLGGETLFLAETVISPHGLAGLALAAGVWTVVSAALLAVVHRLARAPRT